MLLAIDANLFGPVLCTALIRVEAASFASLRTSIFRYMYFSNGGIIFRRCENSASIYVRMADNLATSS